MLAIITSDKSYVNNVLEGVEHTKEICPFPTEVYKCKYKGHNFIIAITGYGKINIGSSLRYICEKYPVKGMLSIGTAGSINNSNEIFSAVIPKSSLQFDVDFTPNGFKPSFIPKIDNGIYITNEDLVAGLQRTCNVCGVNYSNNLIATSDMFVNNYALASNIRKRFEAGAVDCESGSIGQFSYINKIPYACVKIISNYANNNGIKQYNLYDDEASIILQKIINKFLKEFYEA